MKLWEDSKYSKLIFSSNNDPQKTILEAIKNINNYFKKDFFNKTRIITQAEYPELCKIPEEGQDRDEILKKAFSAFDKVPNWAHPKVVHNITPPTLIDATVIKTYTSLFNPNCLWDFVSGNFLKMERDVVAQLGDLIGWDKNICAGLCTFGGKATLIYGIKLALNKLFPNSIEKGLSDNKIAILTTYNAHYSLPYICNLLGIGKESVKIFDVETFGETINSLHNRGYSIPVIVLCGGNSLDNEIDSVKEIAEKLVELELVLGYKPHIHLDAVIGWAWLSFKHYNFESNSWKLESKTINSIKETFSIISEAKYADSIGIDLHKTGLCPYITSVFLTQNKIAFKNLNGINVEENEDFGSNFVQHFSIEHSRGGEGIVSAWLALQQLGLAGISTYLATMLEIRNAFVASLDRRHFEIVNEASNGFCLIFRPKTKTSFYSDSGIKTFFNYTCVEPALPKVIIGFVPYYKPINGAALKIYPMNPETTKRDITEIAEDLVTLKQSFENEDKKNKQFETTGIIPK